MRIFLFIFSLFWISISLGQNDSWVKIVGYVYDEAAPTVRIPNVKIHFHEGEKDKTDLVTDKNGEFIFATEVQENDTLYFEHVGFDSTFYVVTQKQKEKAQKKKKDLRIKVPMKYQEFKVVTVSAKKVDTVYGSTIHSVEDFVMTNEGNLLLLAYEKTLKKGAKIVLIDSDHEDISEAIVPGDAQYLFKDYSGIPYVICEHKIFAIEIVKDQIRFESVSEADFYDFHHRIIDTIGSDFYYSTFNELYPAVTFIVTSKNDTTHEELIDIEDDFMMELYRAQFKYVSGRDKLWAYRQELQTGIDKEIWIGATSFTLDILYKPVYAPLFIIRDTVHVFDQYKKQLYKFDSNHNLVDSVKLDFVQEGQKEKWEQPLILDKQQDKVYGLYNKGGYYYIKSVDCQDGKILKELKLNNRFVERIKIFDGKVYYIYRPYESLQKKFIYSEDLSK